MRVNSIFAIVSVAVITSSAAPVLAQSQAPLGDVARKEEERRKDVKKPAKVYTNKDLGAAAESTPPAEAPKAPTQAATEPAARDAGKAKSDEPAKDQKYWVSRKKELTTQLDRDQTFAAALQTRVNSLTADFTNRDDPAQRGVIGRDRQKSLTELDRLKKAIQDDKKALADLEEEARRAGVPPGWLR